MNVDRQASSRIRRIGYLLRHGALWTTAAALAACASSSDATAVAPPRDDVRSTREALSGGLTDSDSPDTNVVVDVDNGSCTGTLITPQVVLTANHCVYGSVGLGNCHAKTPGAIRIGLNAPTPIPGKLLLPYVDAQTVTNACQPANEASNDVALLYLSSPVTGASLNDPTSLVVPRVVRPRLIGPSDPSFAVAGAQFGVAGYGGFASQRQFGLLTDPRALFYQFDITFGTFRWLTSTANWTTQSGDSGGPLFYEHPDGHLEVLGALFGIVGSNMSWSAITDGAYRDWLLAHVTESNVPAALQHSSFWLSRHGSTRDRWWGELDYSGPCQPAVDRDCDGWWDHGVPPSLIHDNCIYIANPDQRDTNNDGFGDVCQLCPFDPAGNAATMGDSDGDGVCTGSPLGYGLYSQDNCPLVQNASQANCNEEAERVKQRQSPDFEILGDACDPVPCPQTRALATGEKRNPVGGVNPQFGGFLSGRVITDAIEAVRVAPHVKEPPTSMPVSKALPNVLTTGRFCQDNKANGYDCHADPNIRDSAIDDFSSYTTEFASPSKPWHRVLLSLNSTNRDLGWYWSYDNTTAANHTWLYEQDWSYWSTWGMIPPASSPYLGLCSNTELVESGTCLDGTLWYHAATTTGRTANPYSNGQYVGVHDGDIANHYFDIKPDRAYATTYSGTGLMRPYFFLVDTLPDPQPFEALLRSRIRVLGAATVHDPPRMIDDNGASWDASAIVSPALATELATEGIVWTSAIEPAGVAVNLTRSVQAMAISADGTTVQDIVVYDHGVLNSGLDLEYPTSVGASNAPSPRTGFVAVLSRSAGGVFIIGGVDATTNAVLSDIHLWRPEVGWSTIVSSVGFGGVESATFSPVDGNLWVLERRDTMQGRMAAATGSAVGGVRDDESTHGPDCPGVAGDDAHESDGRSDDGDIDERHHGRDTTSASLIRISPWTGIAQRVGTFERGRSWDHHFLAVDRDGQVLLMASSRRNRQTKFARVRVSAGGCAYASQIDAHSIPYTSLGPIVDKDEYGVIVTDDTGAVTSVFRRANLLGRTGTFSLSAFF